MMKKIQTMVSEICEDMAGGKRVLLISQNKENVLDICDHLYDIGAAPFCLNLHSELCDAPLLMRQVKKTCDLKNAGYFDCALDKDKSQQARYDQMLHTLQKFDRFMKEELSCGKCLYELLEIDEAYRDIVLAFELNDEDQEILEKPLDLELVEAFETVLKEYDDSIQDVSKYIHIENASMEDVNTAGEIIDQADPVYHQLIEKIEDLRKILLFPMPKNAREKNYMAGMVGIANILEDYPAYGINPDQILKPEFKIQLEQYEAGLQECNESYKNLCEYFEKKELDCGIDIKELYEALSEIKETSEHRQGRRYKGAKAFLDARKNSILRPRFRKDERFKKDENYFVKKLIELEVYQRKRDVLNRKILPIRMLVDRWGTSNLLDAIDGFELCSQYCESISSDEAQKENYLKAIKEAVAEGSPDVILKAEAVSVQYKRVKAFQDRIEEKMDWNLEQFANDYETMPKMELFLYWRRNAGYIGKIETYYQIREQVKEAGLEPLLSKIKVQSVENMKDLYLKCWCEYHINQKFQCVDPELYDCVDDYGLYIRKFYDCERRLRDKQNIQLVDSMTKKIQQYFEKTEPEDLKALLHSSYEADDLFSVFEAETDFWEEAYPCVIADPSVLDHIEFQLRFPEFDMMIEDEDEGSETEHETEAACDFPPTPFAQAVALRLKDRGHDVSFNVRTDERGVDLAIWNSDHTDYALGILIDSFEEDVPIRNRELVYPKQLQDEGWRLYCLRIMNWYRNPDDEIEKIEACIK